MIRMFGCSLTYGRYRKPAKPKFIIALDMADAEKLAKDAGYHVVALWELPACP